MKELNLSDSGTNLYYEDSKIQLLSILQETEYDAAYVYAASYETLQAEHDTNNDKLKDKLKELLIDEIGDSDSDVSFEILTKTIEFELKLPENYKYITTSRNGELEEGVTAFENLALCGFKLGRLI